MPTQTPIRLCFAFIVNSQKTPSVRVNIMLIIKCVAYACVSICFKITLYQPLSTLFFIQMSGLINSSLSRAVMLQGVLSE